METIGCGLHRVLYTSGYRLCRSLPGRKGVSIADEVDDLLEVEGTDATYILIYASDDTPRLPTPQAAASLAEVHVRVELSI